MKGYKHIQCDRCDDVFYAMRSVHVRCPQCGEMTSASAGYVGTPASFWNRMVESISSLEGVNMQIKLMKGREVKYVGSHVQRVEIPRNRAL